MIGVALPKPLPAVIPHPLGGEEGASDLVLPDTTGMILEYLFSDPYVLLDEDGLVEGVLDRSGQGRHSQTQTDATRRFRYNAASGVGGRPAVERVAATLPYLKTAGGLALSQAFTVYCVGNALGSVTSTILFDGNAAGSRALIWFPSGSQMLGAMGGGIAAAFVPGASGGLFVGSFDGASSELVVNGDAALTGTTGTAALDYFVVGARFSFTANLNGSIAYFAVQAGHPSPASIAANALALRRWFALA